MSRRFTVRVIAAALALLIASVAFLVYFESRCADLRANVLRLHILADSNSEYDQSMKLLLRDMIVSKSGELFADSSDKEEAMRSAERRLSELEELCADTLKEAGYTKTVSVSLGKSIFSTRTYGEYTLPAGEYDSLIVKIGSGEGKNWWCVLFPSICFPAASEVTEESDEFGEDGELVRQEEIEYRIGFRLVEIYWKIRGLFE